MELIIVMLVTLLLAPVVELTTGPFRIVLGTIFLLFFPGYTLMAALFPRKDSLQSIERLTLSFVLSFAVVPLVVLILNYTPWGIRLEPIFAAVAIFIFIASLVALFRRKRLPDSERFVPSIHVKMPHWGSASRVDRVLSIFLVIATAGAMAALIYVVTTPRAEEPFTDFYILGSEEMMENYPRELVLGNQTEVTLGIVNREHQQVDYNVEVMLDGERTQQIGPISLADEEEWQQKVILVATKAGEDQKVEFLLYEGEEAEPYLTIHLWLDVKEEE